MLFKPFKILQSAKDINADGAGLGLYISKCLCRELKGKIWLVFNPEPTIFKSTTFAVEMTVKFDQKYPPSPSIPLK